MKKYTNVLAAVLALAMFTATGRAQGHYQSFTVSTYAIQSTVRGLMNGEIDPEESWATLTRNLKVDKIYIEVMRNHTLVDEAGLEKLKKFYQDKGVEVCGGLAYSVSEANGYQGFDYADPENREFAKKAVEMAARHFDEILLDDYFFFDRKTDYDIKAKGNKSWTQYRLETMRDVAENLIVKPAKAVNPKCKVIIKMANWYDQYAGMGNDTEKVPFIGDGMFSGTESRLWIGQEQHLQPYLSYDIMRFMDNLKPGVNKGGWVDQGGAFPIDRYSEQLLDTVFARCPEMCCFNYAGMIRKVPVFAITNRAWADQPTSLNLAEVQKTLGTNESAPTFADIAGYTLGQVDKVLVNVGKPVGIKCYTPYHATGEEFLHDYLGMIGLPMDIFPQFPTGADMVLLTEQAKFDPDIIQKIKTQLEAGKSVCVTSGFVRAMRGKGIEDICEIEATGKTVPVRRFAFASGPGSPFRGRGFGRNANGPDPFEASRDILIPEIKYFNILTHDAWGEVLGVSPGGTTYPIVLSCDYSKGKLYVLTVPNDPADFYAFPPDVLSVMRTALGSTEPVRLESAPAQVALLRYDNNAFIVQNYLPTPTDVKLSVAGTVAQIHDLLSGKVVEPAPERQRGFGAAAREKRTSFTFTVPPHSYLAFAAKKSE
ncbi:MAG TPA: hypothetical protein VN761_13210 [Candidatus Polarisedimenticolia bacterium]|nr:hypothetical protein [Candidatus Polarisedimenticolia bacterium]